MTVHVSVDPSTDQTTIIFTVEDSHPGDIDGAARAGLQTAWIDRYGTTPYPPYLTAPDVTVSGVDDLSRTLTGNPPTAP